MVINRMPDSGEMGMTREEYFRFRDEDRATCPVVPARRNDRDTIAAIVKIVAERYVIAPADLAAPVEIPALRLRAAVAHAARSLYGIEWQTIAEELGYRNPRTSVGSAQIRHPQLLVDVAALVKDSLDTDKTPTP